MCNFKRHTFKYEWSKRYVKRTTLFKLIHLNKLDVVMVKETHNNTDNESLWNKEWNGELLILSHKSYCSEGIEIVYSR